MNQTYSDSPSANTGHIHTTEELVQTLAKNTDVANDLLITTNGQGIW